jgi:hypothetical protein
MQVKASSVMCTKFTALIGAKNGYTLKSMTNVSMSAQNSITNIQSMDGS